MPARCEPRATAAWAIRNRDGSHKWRCNSDGGLSSDCLRDQSRAAPRNRSSRHSRRTHTWGILGVFLGAGLATLNARLVGVGLPDLRGALGFGFDEASWIPTALNMATMFSGVFVVLLERSVRPAPDSAAGRRDLYGRFRDAARSRRATGRCWR